MKLPERMTLILRHDKSIAVELMIKEAQHYSFTLFFLPKWQQKARATIEVHAFFFYKNILYKNIVKAEVFCCNLRTFVVPDGEGINVNCPNVWTNFDCLNLRLNCPKQGLLL